MNYLSTESFESLAFPGVTVKLKKMSSRRRAEFNLSMAPLLAKARESAIASEPLEQEYLDFQKALETAKASNAVLPEAKQSELPKFPDDKSIALQSVWNEQRRFEQDEMTGPLLRWGIQSISGLNIDEKPADVGSLIEAGPPELAEELVKEVTRVMRLSSAEIKNSASPTTSEVPVDGATNSSTAAPAKSDTSTN
jgi:hypothetical protein